MNRLKYGIIILTLWNILFLFSCKKDESPNVKNIDKNIVGKWSSIYNSEGINSETIELKDDGTYIISSTVNENNSLYNDPDAVHYKSAIQAKGKYSITSDKLFFESAKAEIPNISDDYKNLLKERRVSIASPLFNYYFFQDTSFSDLKIDLNSLPTSQKIISRIKNNSKNIQLQSQELDIEFTGTGASKNYIGTYLKQ